MRAAGPAMPTSGGRGGRKCCRWRFKRLSARGQPVRKYRLLPNACSLWPPEWLDSSGMCSTKGKPKTFRRIRTPIETCRHCGGEVRDYGGHRDAMNDKGVNLLDVWTDIPPVRHWKFKSKKRKANALSTKLLD